jgi:hypothetical protein
MLNSILEIIRSWPYPAQGIFLLVISILLTIIGSIVAQAISIFINETLCILVRGYPAVVAESDENSDEQDSDKSN